MSEGARSIANTPCILPFACNKWQYLSTWPKPSLNCFSSLEFVIDFIKIMPGIPKARVKSRILLTPQHAKRLAKAMAENIAKFESTHGKIKDIENVFPMNFGGPTAQA